MTYPLRLIGILGLRHPLSHSISIDQRPLKELQENAKLGKDVNVGKLIGRFVRSKWIAVRGFGYILPTRIFIERV